MSRKRIAKKIERWAILNANDDLWTDKLFRSEEVALAHWQAFWNKPDMSISPCRVSRVEVIEQ